MEITIVENDAGQRLDRFLRKAFKATPLSLIHKALRKGRVKVNGKRGKGEQPLVAGDVITASDIDFRRLVTITEKVAEYSEDLSPLILFENDRFIVVNKPVGLPVHPGAFHHGDTLIDLIQRHLKHNDGSLSFSPSLAHRLDKGVSGAILACKAADALRLATEHFRENNIRKEYLAIVGGEIFVDEGFIDTPLEDKKGNMLESQTKWRVVERLKDCTLLRVRLLTGRMHQIRRHLSGEGLPIIGDTEYGGRKAIRIMLHSHLLEFKDTLTGKKISVEAPMPDEMKAFVQRCRPISG
ncbi:MAG: RluA family pseudouridine synthase [Fibrobacteres bacterium]|nr:RluA family pseudouridine synthase [Fibrobacterota bacterium]